MDTLKIEVKIDADRASAAFKEARREINRTRRTAYEHAAKTEVLPTARRHTPHFATSHLIAKGTATGAYLTTRGLPRPLARAVGLLEFGGTVRARITPKNARALRTPQGPRAAVNKPRHYAGKHFLTTAARSRVDEFGEAAVRELMHAFDAFDHTT